MAKQPSLLKLVGLLLITRCIPITWCVVGIMLMRKPTFAADSITMTNTFIAFILAWVTWED